MFMWVNFHLALALVLENAVVGNGSYPNPYSFVSNTDGTYTCNKGFPLEQSYHRTYTVFISDTGSDHCGCAIFQKWSYCKHTLAVITKYGLKSKTLEVPGKLKPHSQYKRQRGHQPRNPLALIADSNTVTISAQNAEPSAMQVLDSASMELGPEGWTARMQVKLVVM
jgi:hypothetical protein